MEVSTNLVTFSDFIPKDGALFLTGKADVILSFGDPWMVIDNDRRGPLVVVDMVVLLFSTDFSALIVTDVQGVLLASSLSHGEAIKADDCIDLCSTFD